MTELIKKITLTALTILAITVLLSGCSGTTGTTGTARSIGGAGTTQANEDAALNLSESLTDITVAAAETAEATPLGTFSTRYNAKNKNRSHNIALASEAINRVVVNPGETFSYNETVGPTSKKNGYKRGTIFIKGEMYEGYGGGVCQVSSTLYNAAANAGMTIVERHDHSLPVPYIEKGRDAATSYGGIDFKFTNNKPYPVVIDSHTADGVITVAVNVL